ncbi:hypothetical protein [Clostridium ganghwense]|uniref:Uncharacterized protein n=1 Tax=Clostridium ganghwense TaxID=312089 RepID=A0ABT4CJ44_9CLOT|nr:hypothetical protein [Clostridium ganghwense]MCY6369070.1 hypothetical protein [Clostridium ganghwense]
MNLTIASNIPPINSTRTIHKVSNASNTEPSFATIKNSINSISNAEKIKQSSSKTLTCIEPPTETIDMNEELFKITKNKILMQAVTAMMAHSNMVSKKTPQLSDDDSETSYKVNPIKKSNYLPLNKR